MNRNLTNVHPEAKIGENVTIEPFVTITKDVEIGDGTWIGPNAVIMDGARIGKNCKIFPGAVIAGIPQDLKFSGEYTIVQIGDNTTIRECVTINKGTAAKTRTTIGSNCLLMAYSHVAHDCILKNNVIIGNSVNLAGEVEIEANAIVSAMSGVHQFVKIGTHSFIQGVSKVGKDVPPYVLAGRDPLSYCGLNSVGLRRRGFSKEKILEIQELYRIVYQKGLNTSDAVKNIEDTMEVTPERDEILSFIKSAKRGIIKGLIE
jgi:UDP-N-acetylglucosamine acyltransferase